MRKYLKFPLVFASFPFCVSPFFSFFGLLLLFIRRPTEKSFTTFFCVLEEYIRRILLLIMIKKKTTTRRRDDDKEGKEQSSFGTVVVLKDSFGFLRLTHDYYDPEEDIDDDDDDDDDDDADEATSSSKRLPTLRAQAQLFFHITEYFKNPELREEGEEEEDRPLLAGDVVKFKVVRGGQEKGTGGKQQQQNENKEGKTHKATDVMRCSKGDLRVKIIQEQVEGVVKRGLKGKTKHEAYGGCVSCSLLTQTGENKEEEKKKLMELEFAGANVAESCKKKLKQGMKVQFSLGREPTTRKYVVVDIAPIEGGGVEEKKTKKKEGDENDDDQDEKIEEEEEDEYFEEIPTSYGRVDKLSQSFGFIQKAHGRMPSHNNGNRREEQGLFFHYTALKDKTDVGKLTVGTAVSFEIVKVGTGSAKGKKANAINVQLCDEETVRAIESELRLQRKLAEKEKNAALLDKDGIDGDSWGKKKVNVVDESNNSKNGKKYVEAPASGEEENASSSEQQNDSSVSLELGKIAVVKNGFGFIKCEERVEDVFFHFTQLKNFEYPKVGKIVQFTVHRDQKRDAMVAHDVCEAPQGSKVVFETVDERSVRGVCKERLVFASGRSFGKSSFSSNASNNGTVVVENAGGTSQSYKFKTVVDRNCNPKPGDLVSFCVATDKRDEKKQFATKVKLVQFTGTVVSAKSEGSYGFFSHSDPDTGEIGKAFFHGADVDGGVTLFEGDEATYFVNQSQGENKEYTAKRIKRTKEGPNAGVSTPTRSNSAMGSDNNGRDSPRPQFVGSQFTLSKGPDGTSGFSRGRGKGLAEKATAAVSRLKLDAAEFVLGGGHTSSVSASLGSRDDLTAFEDAEEEEEEEEEENI